MRPTWFGRPAPVSSPSPRDDSARRKGSRRSRPALELMEGRQLLSTINVTTVADNGDNINPIANSLRYAIIQADSAPAGTTTVINFKIGTGQQTLNVQGALPAVTGKVVLNGMTQPGYNSAYPPLIQIDGSQAASGVPGLLLLNTASGSTIEGISVTNWGGGGVELAGTSAVTLTADFIGVDSYSDVAGNHVFGVELTPGSHNNVVQNSVISGNWNNGVVVSGAGTQSNIIRNNKIGLDFYGQYSVDYFGHSLGNGVSGGGGTGVIVNAMASSNVITGNDIGLNAWFGVLITDPGTMHNSVTGNQIGGGLYNSEQVGNAIDGVEIVGGASYNTVGGLTVAARNVIAANHHDGVYIGGAGTTKNVVEGNYIGTDGTGAAANGNGYDGVHVDNGATGNTIGGATAYAANVLSGNGGYGVELSGPGTSNNLVEGNRIGTGKTGTTNIPNATGVGLTYGASANTVGGVVAGARNLISGNSGNGINVYGTGTVGNVVEGNYIGTVLAGNAPLGNGLSGVALFGGASGNTIGGPTAANRNVLSGNFGDGVWISDPGTTGNTVQGDFIGTDYTGTLPLGNAIAGVKITGGATSNTVSGSVLSANTNDGVWLDGQGTRYNQVVNNKIGTDYTGTKVLANTPQGYNYSSNYGVLIGAGASYNNVYGNVIAGNNAAGVAIFDTDPRNSTPAGTTGNAVFNNAIGTSAAGTLNLGNKNEGVLLSFVAGNNVYNNKLSYNGDVGVLFLNSDSEFFYNVYDNVFKLNAKGDVDVDDN